MEQYIGLGISAKYIQKMHFWTKYNKEKRHLGQNTMACTKHGMLCLRICTSMQIAHFVSTCLDGMGGMTWVMKSQCGLLALSPPDDLYPWRQMWIFRWQGLHVTCSFVLAMSTGMIGNFRKRSLCFGWAHFRTRLFMLLTRGMTLHCSISAQWA